MNLNSRVYIGYNWVYSDEDFLVAKLGNKIKIAFKTLLDKGSRKWLRDLLNEYVARDKVKITNCVVEMPLVADAVLLKLVDSIRSYIKKQV